MQIPYVTLFSTAWRYADQHQRRKMIWTYGLLFLANMISASGPLVHGWFVNSLQKSGPTYTVIGTYIVVFLSMLLVQWGMYGPARVMERHLAFQISQRFISVTMHKLLNLPVHWHKTRHSGRVNNQIRKAYGAIRAFLESGYTYFQTIIQLTLSLGAIFYFSPAFGFVALCIGAVGVWMNFQFDKPFVKSLQESNRAEHVAMGTLSDSLTNIYTVLTLRLERPIQNEIVKKVADMFIPFRRNVVVNEWRWFSNGMLVNFTYIIVLVGYVYTQYLTGEKFFLGPLVALLGFISQFTAAFSTISFQYGQLLQFRTDIHSTAEIDMETVITKAEIEADGHRWKDIMIKDLSFQYDDAARSVASGQYVPRSGGLEGVDLVLKRGQRIALVGESGSGKSTLMALLRGLYTPTVPPDLRIDSKEKCAWDAVAGTTTLIPQDPEIFENTVLYNVTLGLAFQEEEIRQACEIACLSDVIDQLPEGLDTVIAEKGMNLSGGQRQRVALVRGLLASNFSSLVLLDEPTSCLDTKTEERIFDNMFTALKDKTVICSVHSLSLLSKFDYVYVLSRGRVVDEGIPSQLNLLQPVADAEG